MHNAAVGPRAAAAMLLLLTATLTACARRPPAPPPLADVPRPIVFAHRGGAGEAPENTLAAMRAALAANPRVAIELDVRRSRDGHLVVIHDATVDRTTDGTGAVADLPLARLQALDAGYCATPGLGHGTAPPGRCPRDPLDGSLRARFPFRGQGHRVPTLDEVFAALPADTLIGIEVKSGGYEQQVATLVQRSGRQRRLVIGSADDAVAVKLRPLLPGLAHYFPKSAGLRFAAATKLTGGALARPDYQVFAVPLTGAGLHLDTAGMVRAAHGSGVLISYWTINDPAEMDRLVRLGADAIITDYPGRATRATGGAASIKGSAASTRAP
jgi:glycerophosphoryl diester phosphodiesterase